MCKEDHSQVDDVNETVSPDSYAACQKCGIKTSRVITSRSVESVETFEYGTSDLFSSKLLEHLDTLIRERFILFNCLNFDYPPPPSKIKSLNFFQCKLNESFT